MNKPWRDDDNGRTWDPENVEPLTFRDLLNAAAATLVLALVCFAFMSWVLLFGATS
jgi:hypothetical protein